MVAFALAFPKRPRRSARAILALLALPALSVYIVAVFFLLNRFSVRVTYNNKVLVDWTPGLGNASTDYAHAAKYFETLGYSRCEALSRKQEAAGLWMHLRSDPEYTCDRVFESYAKIANKLAVWPPPEFMPSHLTDDYTLHGRAKLGRWYFNSPMEQYAGAPVVAQWTRALIDDYIANVYTVRSLGWYGLEGLYFLPALSDFNVTGKNGLVIGSENPWLEALLLAFGKAASVMTVDYGLINSSHPQVSYVHPLNLRRTPPINATVFTDIVGTENNSNFPSKNWQRFADKRYDFAASFSSLEHSGLGRYGDQLDPTGDLKEMLKLSCLLADGALVFLGLPYGEDAVFWNGMRRYGKWRIPLLAANFEILAVYEHSKLSRAFEAVESIKEHYSQKLIVLRNVRTPRC